MSQSIYLSGTKPRALQLAETLEKRAFASEEATKTMGAAMKSGTDMDAYRAICRCAIAYMEVGFGHLQLPGDPSPSVVRMLVGDQFEVRGRMVIWYENPAKTIKIA